MSGQQLVRLSFLLWAACQSGASPEPAPDASEAAVPGDEPTPLAAVGPERPVGLLARAQLAFRASGDRFVGGYNSHEAIVDDGAVTFTPVTFDHGARIKHPPTILETVAITSGEIQLIETMPAMRADNGAVMIARGDITEIVANREEGIHQEWRFETAPAGGDLTVEVGVANYRFASSTDSGLHFRSGDDKIGFRYSHAIWVSADGNEWAIPATFEGDRIRMTVPETIVERTRFPAVLDPTVTAEIVVDAPVPGFTGAPAQRAAAAFDGTNYLVVWEDSRNSQDSDIWGIRVSASGTILDNTGIEIRTSPGKQQNPDVTFDGSQFVVAWEDFKVAGGSEADIGAATVSSTGVVTQLAAVAATGGNETTPKLSGLANSTILVWSSGTDVVGAVRTTGGFGAPFTLGPAGVEKEDPAVARSPSGNLVVWSEGATAKNVRGQFVSAGGAPGAQVDISLAAGSQINPGIAFNGTDFVVVWENNNSGVDIFGTRVGTDGTVRDTRLEGAITVGGVVISAAASSQQTPSVACAGSGCLVIYRDRRNFAATGFDILAQLVDANFALVGSEIVLSNATLDQSAPDLAAAPNGYLTVWGDSVSPVTIFGVTVSATGTLGTTNNLARGNHEESSPHLGSAGSAVALFWSDTRTFPNAIRYERFSTTGTRIDTVARIATDAAVGTTTPAASAALGANTLLVWADHRNGTSDIFATTVDLSTGTSTTPAGVSLATAVRDQVAPDVASSGSVALAVWQDRRNSSFDIFGALVDSAGNVIASDIVISDAATDQTRPAVTFDTASGQFIVVWSDGRTGSPQIFGARVSTTGQVLDPAGVAVSVAANSRFAPAITSSTAGSFAVWEDRRSGRHIFGSRLTGGASLTVLDPNGIPITLAAGTQTAPQIAPFGATYVVIWVDSRNVQTDIFGQQLTLAGALLGAEFAVSNSPASELQPTIRAAGGKTRVAYLRAELNTQRVYTRMINAVGSNGETCSGSSQCDSGFCVDGVCCESACGGNHVPAPGNPPAAGDCHGCRATLTGQPNGVCAPVSAGTVCRRYASTFCDIEEKCDGISLACGDDIGRRQGQACNLNTNKPAGVGTGVCPSNAAPGPHFCQ